MTIQIEDTEQYFPVVFPAVVFKEVVLPSYLKTTASEAILSCGSVCYAGSTFSICGEHPKV